MAIFFRDPTFSSLRWQLYAQVVSSDLCGELTSIRLVVRAIEPVSDSGVSADIFDEARWKKLRADVAALTQKAGTT